MLVTGVKLINANGEAMPSFKIVINQINEVAIRPMRADTLAIAHLRLNVLMHKEIIGLKTLKKIRKE